MSETEGTKSFTSGGPMRFCGLSLVAHFLGSWFSLTVFFEIRGDTEGVLFSLIGSLFSVLVLMPITLGTWFITTLPFSTFCLHSGVNQNVFFTTLIGALPGTLLMLIGVLVGDMEEMVEAMLFFALAGGFIAAVFSLITREWGKQFNRNISK